MDKLYVKDVSRYEVNLSIYLCLHAAWVDIQTWTPYIKHPEPIDQEVFSVIIWLLINTN